MRRKRETPITGLPGLRIRCQPPCWLVFFTAALVLVGLRVADAQVVVDVVHAFPSAGPVQPAAPLLRASDGKFYGTTQFGGSHNAGTVFSLTADGVFTVLHEFDGAGGANPATSLVEASNGFLYGTTLNGGLGIGSVQDSNGYGTIFRMAPTAHSLSFMRSAASMG